jgi:hypothetical protein
MQAFLAFIIGAATAVFAILIHQTLPPFGVIAGLIFTYTAIWLVGRKFAARKYKVYAAIGWTFAMLRAATFGAGQELLVQGDGVGTSILLVGVFVAFAAIASRI